VKSSSCVEQGRSDTFCNLVLFFFFTERKKKKKLKRIAVRYWGPKKSYYRCYTHSCETKHWHFIIEQEELFLSLWMDSSIGTIYPFRLWFSTVRCGMQRFSSDLSHPRTYRSKRWSKSHIAIHATLVRQVCKEASRAYAYTLTLLQIVLCI